MTAIENTSSFGYWIRRRRKALDLTQAELAEMVGCALPTIKKIESDERRPSIVMAQRLADCLEIPLSAKEIFIKVARRVYSPERFPPKNRPDLGKRTSTKVLVNTEENKNGQVNDHSFDNESTDRGEIPSQPPDFGR